LRKESLTIPEISEADRAAGFRDWPVLFCDGHSETLRVNRPDPMRMVQILNLDSMTEQVYTTIAHASGESIEFVFGIDGKSIVELFLVSNGLASDAIFRKALWALGEIGQTMIGEILPGGPANPSDN
jgi:hypothetical protein